MKKSRNIWLLAVLVVLLILQLTGIGIPNIPNSTIAIIVVIVLLMEISKKYGPVTLLAKKSSRADEIFKHDESVKKIIYLDRQKEKGKHSGIRGAWLLSKEIKNSVADGNRHSRSDPKGL